MFPPRFKNPNMDIKPHSVFTDLAALRPKIRLTTLRAYWEVCKPRVVALMLFTALVGMLLAAPDQIDTGLILTGLLGIALVAAAAAAINHIADHRVDAVMSRTQNRPLPAGELSRGQTVIFATLIGVSGTTILVLWVNLLTAALTLLSLLGYSVIYTRYLKYATPQNIVIGGAAGATPPLLGWTTVTGQIDPTALILFLIIFTWTPPHFWALALNRKEEYMRANVPMLPVTHGERYTCLQVLLYTVLLCVVSLLPYVIGTVGITYLAGAALLDGVYLYYALRLFHLRDRATAGKAFEYSILYLMLLFALLLSDAYLPMIASAMSGL